uniref:C2H2-type domain-containing protein n=1 Tax=Moniliophthora roreri TaxID=221103 RepID=A0A0W0G7W1_MONRR
MHQKARYPLNGTRWWTDPNVEYIDLYRHQTPIKQTNEKDRGFFADDPESVSTLVNDALSVHVDFGAPSGEFPDDLDIAPPIPSPSPFSTDSQGPSVPEIVDIHQPFSPSPCLTENSSVTEPLSRPPSPPPSLCDSWTDSEESGCSTPDASDFDLSDSYSEAMDLDTEYSEEQSSDMESDGYESSCERRSTSQKSSVEPKSRKTTSTPILSRKKVPAKRNGSRKLKQKKPKTARIPCSLCSQTFTREADRDRHLSSVHKEPIVSEPNFRERSQCRFCGKEFSRPDAKARHESARSALCRKIARQRYTEK